MRVLLRFSAAFVAGAALALCLLAARPALALGLAALAGAAVLLFRRRPLGILLLGLGLGLLWTVGYRYAVERPALTLADRTLEVHGTAVDYSTETAYGQRVQAEISDGTATARAVVWLYTSAALKPGDRFTVLCSVRDASDYGGYRSEGVHLLAYGQGEPELETAPRVPLRYGPRWIAHRLEQALSACVPADALGYATALTTGNRTYLTSLETEQLKTSGIYHMLALSGLHMTVLVGMVTALFRKKRARALAGIPLCVGFAVVTGASPSVVRAAVMQCLILLAPLLGREEDAPTSLAAAALAMTVQNPFCILSWGMQLSFASMAGLLLFSGKIYEALDRRLPKPGRLKGLRRYILSSLSATAGAMSCSAPLLMVCFGMLSLVSPLTNLLTGWAVGWCFRGSLLTALVGCVSTGAGQILGWLLAWPVRYVRAVAALMSRIPFVALYTGGVYGTGWVLLVYGVLAAFLRAPRDQRRPVVPACCILGSLAVCLLLTVMPEQGLALTVLDVGQGQCLLLRSGGETIVVDCGGSYGDACGDMAAAELLSGGENRVDALVVTHYDGDHTGGVMELMGRMKVSWLLLPDMEPENETRQALEAAARAQGTSVRYVSETVCLTLGAGTAEVYPPHNALGGNDGLSLLCSVGGVEVLATGDMDAEAEEALLRERQIPQVDILVAGHHGSRSSTGEALLEAARPRLVVISVGRNSYGQPAWETLERCREMGAVVYRTDLYGTLKVRGT